MNSFQIRGVFFGDLKGPDAASVIDSAQDAVARHQENPSFEKLAESGTEVLNATWQYPTALSARDPILLRAVRQLRPGQDTGLIRLNSGLWFIELLDFRPARQLTLEESSDSIRKTLEERKMQAAQIEKRTEILQSLDIQFVPDPVRDETVEQTPAQDAFFDALHDLCETRFEGRAVYPDDPGDDFRDKILTAHIAACSEQEIRIPFTVGENASRTWILRKTEDGLQLKHDHRHADGTPDEVTMYGGTTESTGTATSQSFPADAHTAELIPDAATNQWFLSLENEGQTLVYYLERHGKPRFRAVLTQQ